MDTSLRAYDFQDGTPEMVLVTDLIAALRNSDAELMRLREVLKGAAGAYVDSLHVANAVALAKVQS